MDMKRVLHIAKKKRKSYSCSFFFFFFLYERRMIKKRRHIHKEKGLNAWHEKGKIKRENGYRKAYKHEKSKCGIYKYIDRHVHMRMIKKNEMRFL